MLFGSCMWAFSSAGCRAPWRASPCRSKRDCTKKTFMFKRDKQEHLRNVFDIFNKVFLLATVFVRSVIPAERTSIEYAVFWIQLNSAGTLDHHQNCIKPVFQFDECKTKKCFWLLNSTVYIQCIWANAAKIGHFLIIWVCRHTVSYTDFCWCNSATGRTLLHRGCSVVCFHLWPQYCLLRGQNLI